MSDDDAATGCAIVLKGLAIGQDDDRLSVEERREQRSETFCVPRRGGIRIC
jgi:hypothetical protein